MTTTKIISTYYGNGYDLAQNTNLYITPTGGVGGLGVLASYEGETVTNYGFVNGHAVTGVSLVAGGDLVNGSSFYNGAIIEGGAGVRVSNYAGSVTNYGTILGTHHQGVVLYYGGNVTNGAGTDTTALIKAQTQGVGLVLAGTVNNFGTIEAVGAAAGDVGVQLNVGGDIYNGGFLANAKALIGGVTGVLMDGAGFVGNGGTIEGLGGDGIDLDSGGQVDNGRGRASVASIYGSRSGIEVSRAAGGVINYGGIGGVREGVYLAAGGKVVNFGSIGAQGVGILIHGAGYVSNVSSGDGSATITGGYGEAVFIVGGAGTVINLGALTSRGGFGVYLASGGVVTNGRGNDRGALISGYTGVNVTGGTGSIANGGTIEGTGARGQYGVVAGAGVMLTNGSKANTGATIEGYDGVKLSGASTAVNFGAILGQGDENSVGVYINGTGAASLTNGGRGQPGALIEGYSGVIVAAANATVTNYGAIEGLGGLAIELNSSDTLAVEAGSTFIGVALGLGATIDLASGVGTLSALGGGYVTVSGSMAATTFTAFNTIEVAAGATFTDTGAVTIAAGDSLIAAGSLTLGGTKTGVANAGTLSVVGGTMIVKGAVTGKGVATINGGLLDLTSSFTQNVTFTGATGTLELSQSVGYTGNVTGFSKSGGTSLDLADIGFVSSGEATYSGTKSGGVLTVTDGTHTATINLKGNYLSSTFVASSDGHGGTDIKDPKAPAAAPLPTAAPPHQLIAAMAGMGASGAGPWATASHAPRVPCAMLARPATMTA